MAAVAMAFGAKVSALSPLSPADTDLPQPGEMEGLAEAQRLPTSQGNSALLLLRRRRRRGNQA